MTIQKLLGILNIGRERDFMNRNHFELITILKTYNKEYLNNKAKDYIKGTFPKTVGDWKELFSLIESNCMVGNDTEIHFSFNGESEFQLWLERDLTLDEYDELRMVKEKSIS